MGQSSMNGWFSIAMFDCRRVLVKFNPYFCWQNPDFVCFNYDFRIFSLTQSHLFSPAFVGPSLGPNVGPCFRSSSPIRCTFPAAPSQRSSPGTLRASLGSCSPNTRRISGIEKMWRTDAWRWALAKKIWRLFLHLFFFLVFIHQNLGIGVLMCLRW